MSGPSEAAGGHVERHAGRGDGFERTPLERLVVLLRPMAELLDHVRMAHDVVHPGPGQFHDQLVVLRIHVEDENLAAVQTAKPQLAPVVGKSTVMRLKSSADRVTLNDLAEVRRTWLDVHRDELVGAISESFDPERPDVEKLLLPFDAGEVGRGTRFIGARCECGRRHREEGGGEDGQPGESICPADLLDWIWFHTVEVVG